MEISQERFLLALSGLKPSDWERFERLASTFLVSEWPKLRTMASPSGDGGRDSELFCADGAPNLAIQYSVQLDWAEKIRATAKRLAETFSQASIFALYHVTLPATRVRPA
ncbi:MULTISPECIES: hypothetical protein [Bradyrhizobium]|uniref:hypothetical protein n=1 Tax=Bradyrhizobium TaxID=374 RepID=UPI00293E1C41|nr:hypothetical protein [Bradyrhizobium sp. NDS-1]WOH74706.1 hypothetical protein RX330_06170 [Bradyrhizobium sp. NDS-1]